MLPSGYALPSTRVMAKDLRIGRNTVIAACDQLALEGYLAIPAAHAGAGHGSADAGGRGRESIDRGGNAISARGQIMLAQPYHHGKPGMLAFHPGMPDPDNFPFNTWSRLLARRAKLAHFDLFGTYHVKGYPPLCEAIARYLTASRGVKCEPSRSSSPTAPNRPSTCWRGSSSMTATPCGWRSRAITARARLSSRRARSSAR